MKKLLTLVALLTVMVLVLPSRADGAYCEQVKKAIGTLHGSAACTVNLVGFLYGASAARFTFRGDTIVDTVSYYDVDVQVGPNVGTGWSSSIALVSDSITLNSEGTTKFVSDTLAATTKFITLVGMWPRSRVILTPTVLAAKQGIKNCTLWVTVYKQ